MSNSNRVRNTVTLADAAIKLRKGEKSEVANITGYSQSHICNVISGRRKDKQGVVLDAVKLITKGRRK